MQNCNKFFKTASFICISLLHKPSRCYIYSFLLGFHLNLVRFDQHIVAKQQKMCFNDFIAKNRTKITKNDNFTSKCSTFKIDNVSRWWPVVIRVQANYHLTCVSVAETGAAVCIVRGATIFASLFQLQSRKHEPWRLARVNCSYSDCEWLPHTAVWQSTGLTKHKQDK